MSPAKPPSLARRLAIGIAAAQLAALLGWTLVWMLFSPYVTYQELAAATAARHVAASVAVGSNGARLVPTDALLAYAARRPGFAYAALYDGRTLPGSSPELARRLAGTGVPGAGAFRLPDGTPAQAESLRGAGLPLTVVTTGNRFGLDDAPTFFLTYLPQILAMFAPAFLAAAAVTPLAVRRALRPVRDAAEASASIGVDTLDRRLSTHGMPGEVLPFATAINRLLARLQEGVKAQRLLSANAAHELRTPVAVLAARVGSMPDGPDTRALQRDVQRLGLLVDQLLAAARLRGPAAAGRAPLDLGTLVADVVADLAPLALLTNREAEARLPPGPVTVAGDPDALRSAIANLLDNALRAEPEGGTVLAELRTEDGAALVEVSDHGPGIPPADRERVFEPFWRGGGPWQGTGLGLAITRQVVESHGGQVTCHTAPGLGALFRIRLPLAPGDARE